MCLGRVHAGGQLRRVSTEGRGAGNTGPRSQGRVALGPHGASDLDEDRRQGRLLMRRSGSLCSRWSPKPELCVWPKPAAVLGDNPPF